MKRQTFTKGKNEAFKRETINFYAQKSRDIHGKFYRNLSELQCFAKTNICMFSVVCQRLMRTLLELLKLNELHVYKHAYIIFFTRLFSCYDYEIKYISNNYNIIENFLFIAL